MAYCVNCGEQVSDGTRYCNKCGQPVSTATPPRTEGEAGAFGVAALATGIIGLLVLPILLGPAAIILGSVGRSRGERFATGGIVLGSISLLIVVVSIVSCQMKMEQILRHQPF